MVLFDGDKDFLEEEDFDDDSLEDLYDDSLEDFDEDKDEDESDDDTAILFFLCDILK